MYIGINRTVAVSESFEGYVGMEDQEPERDLGPSTKQCTVSKEKRFR